MLPDRRRSLGRRSVIPLVAESRRVEHFATSVVLIGGVPYCILQCGAVSEIMSNMSRLAVMVLLGALLVSPSLVVAQSAPVSRAYLALTPTKRASQACSRFAGPGLFCMELRPRQEKAIDESGKLDLVSYALDCNGESASQLRPRLSDLLLGRSVCGVVLLGNAHMDAGVDVPTVRFLIVHSPPSDAGPSASVVTTDDGTLAALFASGFTIVEPDSNAAQMYVARLERAKREELLERVQSLEFATQAQDKALAYETSQQAYLRTKAAYVDFCRHQIETAQLVLDRDRQAWATADVEDRALRHRAEDIISKCRNQIDGEQ